MLSGDEILKELAFAIEESGLNLDSTMDNTENWDSLGQLSIFATLAKLTNGATDKIPGIATATTMRGIFAELKDHGLIE
ncbi:MAG TPA: hypothetical protein VMW30_09120 [Candidatus Paceibacterota bacterium]|nr:hypothetical protein [Candidatus Paceibacterota bacterium]